jgi:rhodanese-related sulfurtransferase
VPRDVTRDEVGPLVEQEGATLVEVLPRAEFDEEHLPGAISLPLKQLTRETAARLPRDKPIVTYCYDRQ